MRGILYDVSSSNRKTVLIAIIFLIAFIRTNVVRVGVDIPIFGLASAIFSSVVMTSYIPTLKEERVIEYIFAYSKRRFRVTLIYFALSYSLIASVLSVVPLYDKPLLALYAITSTAPLTVMLVILELILPSILARLINFILVISVFALVGYTNLDVWILPPLLIIMATLVTLVSLSFENKIRERVVSPA